MSTNGTSALALLPFAEHPAMLPDAGAAAWAATDAASAAPWTLDMDDMLRTAVRKSGFHFEVAARQIQGYVLRVRAAGGILPEAVVEPLYTADECRLRWSRLDLAHCTALRDLATCAPATAAGPAAASGSAIATACGDAISRVREGFVNMPEPSKAADNDDDSDNSDGSSENDYGIVDLNVLRAQRLGGLFGAAPSSSSSVAKSSRPAANGRVNGGRRTGAGSTPSHTSTGAAEAIGPHGAGTAANGAVARGTGPTVDGEAGEEPDFSVLSGRSLQLAELEGLAAELAAGSPRGAATDAVATDEGAKHQVAAATLVGPLGDLKRRMEGLEALLSDEATSMAAKLGEVAQVHREMAELQTLAQQVHTTGGADGAPPPSASEVKGERGAAAGGATSATGGGGGAINLEAALDGLDIDGLLSRLEAQRGDSS